MVSESLGLNHRGFRTSSVSLFLNAGLTRRIGQLLQSGLRSMPVTLGGETAWRVRAIGEYIISYQWLDSEPCMFIRRRDQQRGGAFALPLHAAHQWAHSDGHPDLSHAIPTAVRALETMGSFPTKDSVRKLVDIVVDGIPDLLDMPQHLVKPRDKPAPAIGELITKIAGETVDERVVTAEGVQ